jgi:hypothetical protein
VSLFRVQNIELYPIFKNSLKNKWVIEFPLKIVKYYELH